MSTVDLQGFACERTSATVVRIVVESGVIAGQVRKVDDHPRAQKIWLAHVDIGDGGTLVQIVFGGRYPVQAEDLVPVAPPGAVVRFIDERKRPIRKRMRVRRYRGERSHGMLCSLDELGWAYRAPDEVATLRNVVVGDSLDGLSISDRRMKVDRHRSLLVAPLNQSACHEVGRSAAKD